MKITSVLIVVVLAPVLSFAQTEAPKFDAPKIKNVSTLVMPTEKPKAFNKLPARESLQEMEGQMRQEAIQQVRQEPMQQVMQETRQEINQNTRDMLIQANEVPNGIISLLRD